MKKRKLTFAQRVIFGFTLCVLILCIGEFTGVSLLYNIAWSLFGLTFIIWPDVPATMKYQWSPEKCRAFSRMLGVSAIFGAWVMYFAPLV